VTIVRKPSFVTAGAKYEFVCQTRGSKPRAVVTWIKDRVLIDPSHIEVVSADALNVVLVPERFISRSVATPTTRTSS
jgi:hypothetical protein